ncbi:MAG TPA: hypothetical protein VF484_05920, partial [Candidatus Limnocylindrales bacterium]
MAGTLGRGVAAALVTFGGLVAAAALLGASGWSWLVLVPVGLLAGSIAGRASGAWFALAGLATFEAAAIALDLPRDAGPF